MNNSIFVETATSIFGDIQIKYHFNIAIENDVLTYSNKYISFSLCFERFFEIYCYFNIKNCKIRLIDIAAVMQIEESDITLLSFNQISNKEGITFVLTNLHNFLEKHLDQVILKQNTIYEHWQLSRQIQLQNEVTKSILSQLEILWKTGEFAKFLELYVDTSSPLRFSLNQLTTSGGR